MGRRLATALEQLMQFPGYWIYPRHSHAWYLPQEKEWPVLLRPLIRILRTLPASDEVGQTHTKSEHLLSVQPTMMSEAGLDAQPQVDPKSEGTQQEEHYTWITEHRPMSIQPPIRWAPYWRTRALVSRWNGWMRWYHRIEEPRGTQLELLFRFGSESWLQDAKALYIEAGNPQGSDLMRQARNARLFWRPSTRRRWVEQVDRLFVTILYPLMELKIRSIQMMMEPEALSQNLRRSRMPDPNLSVTQLGAQQLMIFPSFRMALVLSPEQQARLVLEWLERTENLDGAEWARLAWCCFWYSDRSGDTREGHRRLRAVGFRDDRLAQSCRTDLAIMDQDFGRALLLIRDGMSAGWNQMDFFCMWSQILFQIGAYTEAAQVCRAALDRCGFYPRLAVNLGFSLLENGDIPVTEAQRCFEWIRAYYIRTQKPFPMDLLFGLSRVYGYLGRHHLVRKYLKELLRRTPEFPNLQANLLEASVALGDWNEVDQILKAAKKHARRHPLFRAYSLIFSLRKGECDLDAVLERMESLFQSLKREVRWIESGIAAQVASLFSHVLFERNCLDAALRWAYRFLLWGNQSDSAWFQMAQILQARGEEDALEELLKAAKTQLPPCSQDLLQASLAIWSGDFGQAEEWVDEAERRSQGRREHDVLEMRIEMALLQGLEQEYHYWCEEYRRRCPEYALPMALKKNPWERGDERGSD